MVDDNVIVYGSIRYKRCLERVDYFPQQVPKTTQDDLGNNLIEHVT